MESIDRWTASLRYRWMIDLPNYVRTLSFLGGEEEGEGQQDGEAGEGDGTEMMSHGLWFSICRENMEERGRHTSASLSRALKLRTENDWACAEYGEQYIHIKTIETYPCFCLNPLKL